MAMCRNIDLFDQYAADVLGRLYESFPVKCQLDVRNITGHAETNEYGAICAPGGRPSKEAEIAYATIEWLVDTGYIRADHRSPGFSFQGCVLSPRGLEVLKSVPESVKVKETIGDKLVRLLREGSIDLAKDAVRAAISAGARMIS